MLLRRTRRTCRGRTGCGCIRCPRLVALLGWIFVFVTTDIRVIGFGVGILAAGLICFLVWSSRHGQWPFRPATPA